MKTLEEKGIGMHFLVHNTLGVKGACWGFKIGTRKNDKWVNCSHGSTQNKQQIGWCMDESWAYTNSQDSPRLKLGVSHHLPPYNILCAYPRGYTQMSFCFGSPNLGIQRENLKIPEIETSVTLVAHNVFVQTFDWGEVSSKNYNPRWEISNIMLHVTCT